MTRGLSVSRNIAVWFHQKLTNIVLDSNAKSTAVDEILVCDQIGMFTGFIACIATDNLFSNKTWTKYCSHRVLLLLHCDRAYIEMKLLAFIVEAAFHSSRSLIWMEWWGFFSAKALYQKKGPQVTVQNWYVELLNITQWLQSDRNNFSNSCQISNIYGTL